MKANFDMLDKSEKIRVIIFTVITVIAAAIVLGFIWGAHGGRFYRDENVGSSGSIFVDLTNLATSILDSIFAQLFYIIGGNVFIANIEALAYGIFYAKTLKRIEFVNETEYNFAWCALTIILIVSTVTAVFMTWPNFIELLFTGWPIFFMWLFGYLFYIYPLKDKCKAL